MDTVTKEMILHEYRQLMRVKGRKFEPKNVYFAGGLIFAIPAMVSIWGMVPFVFCLIQYFRADWNDDFHRKHFFELKRLIHIGEDACVALFTDPNCPDWLVKEMRSVLKLRKGTRLYGRLEENYDLLPESIRSRIDKDRELAALEAQWKSN